MSQQRPFTHIPVMTGEVVERLLPGITGPNAGRLIIDCTLGGGGHAGALLRAAPSSPLLGIDADEDALDAARRELSWAKERVRLAKGNFREISALHRQAGGGPVGAVVYDLGVSSHQLDRAERGFGYRGDGRLDMRMDRSLDISAEDIVNDYDEDRLSRIISSYGEERFSRRIVRAIVARREQRRFTQASDLADVVKEAIPAAARRRGPHPARRTFQALRIAVNSELESLEESLPDAVDLLEPQGRVAVISYHSLEDRIVKRIFVAGMKGCTCPRDLPVCVCGREAALRVVTRKPLRPTPEEVAANPRSDSARMRVAEKLRSAEAA